jgi:hypothetical protein
MPSLRANEGYMIVDHRYSPGIPKELEDFWVAQGKILPGEVVPSGMVHETGLQTCSHCQRVLIMNPLRQRERHLCPTCYHYICDRCAAIRAVDHTCHNIYRVLDELQEAAFRALNVSEV